MLLILPLLAFYLFYRLFSKKGFEWRVAFLIAAVLWGTSLLVITELLSIPRWIYPDAIAIGWAVVSAAILVYGRISGQAGHARVADAPVPAPAVRAPLHRSSKWLLGGIAVLVLGVTLTALLMPPASWDAMEYHLPRTRIWMSDHSVRFFATPNYCQLVYGPWAEYATMQTQELWGSDRLVNLIEVFSLIGSIIAVSLIAQLFGGGTGGQVLAAVACATIPQGLLEASGAMNVYVESFWIIVTIACLLLWNRRGSVLFAVCAGCAAGLAVATKGTAYLFLPLLVLACWWMGSRQAKVRFAKLALLFMLPILLLNLPQYVRNYEFVRNPLGVPTPDHFGEMELRNAHVTIRGTLANAVRNVSLHFGVVGHRLNADLLSGFRLVISRGFHVNPDDPAYIWHGNYHLNHYSLNEVTAGDPLSFLLSIAVLGIVIWKRKRFSKHRLASYALGIIGAFLLFSALLRWQMWGGRYQLPLFVAAAPLIGVVLECCFNARFATVLAGLLLVVALPDAFANRFRSLVPIRPLQSVYYPRQMLYFAEEHMGMAPTYISLASAVNESGCGNVAIDAYTAEAMSAIQASPASWFDYPLFALIHADGIHRTVWYTDVHNLSSKYADVNPHPAPCAVVCLQCATVPEKMQEYESGGGRATVIGSDVLFRFEPAELHAGATPLRDR